MESHGCVWHIKEECKYASENRHMWTLIVVYNSESVQGDRFLWEGSESREKMHLLVS